MSHVKREGLAGRRGVAGTVLAALGVLGVGAGMAVQPAKSADKPGGSTKGFAVVELFTSEGCSSCPSADAALAAVHAKTRSAGEPVYTLSFHVDYWNNLGWPDRFSTAANTQRQRRYAQVFKNNSVYTPQAIVNGAAEFVGSDSSRLDKEVRGGLAAAPQATISLAQQPWSPNQRLTLTANVEHAPAGALLCAALCEDGLTNHVKAGENSGRSLSHDGVVRDFQVSPISEGGVVKISLTPPEDIDPSKASIVLYVQDAGSMRVLGATGAALQVAQATKPAPAADAAPAKNAPAK